MPDLDVECGVPQRNEARTVRHRLPLRSWVDRARRWAPLLALAGCSDAAPPTPFESLSVVEEAPSTEPGTGVPEAAHYEPVQGMEGLGFEGRVRFRGRRPRHSGFAVPRRRDVCGSTQPYVGFEVGPGGGLQNAFVRLEGIKRGRGFRAEERRSRLRQERCQLSPQALVVPLGETLVVESVDETVHSLRAEFTDGELWFAMAQPQAGVLRVPPAEREGTALISCQAGHPWEHAVVHVTRHPYATVTDEDGAFVFDAVPSGGYTLVAWHPGLPGDATVGGRPRLEEPLVHRQLLEVVATAEELTIDFTIEESD
ncbi:MAG: hypothetical protein AAGF12_26655 [Myxococcota bacterium]